MSDSSAPLPANLPIESYSFALLFSEPPTLDLDALGARLDGRCGPVELLPPAGGYQLVQLVWPAPDAPSQAIIYAPGPLDHDQAWKALRQTWDWPAAEAVLGQCRTSLLVSDYLAQRLPYPTRLHRIQQLTAAIAEMTPCLAIHAPRCQLLANAAAFVHHQGDDPEHDQLYGAVNVRLFEVEDQHPGDRLMDTLGLHALGLPDLQCHFHGLEPEAVGQLLYHYAHYLYEKGDVIEDGHAIEALMPGQYWSCRHSLALADPERVVLDVAVGPSFPERPF